MIRPLIRLCGFSFAFLLLSCGDDGRHALQNDAAVINDAKQNDGSVYVPPQDGDVVIYAAGDVSGAGSSYTGDEQTAQVILDAQTVDAVFALGDLQYEKGEYDNFANYYDKSWGQKAIKDKTFPVPGNHESDDPTGAFVGYFKYFGMNGTRTTRPGLAQPTEGFYSFDIGHWHIVALNTDQGITQVEEDWLSADLAATSKKCVLAMGHHPRYSAAKYGVCDVGIPNKMQELFQFLVDGKVDIYLAGHDHQYQRFAKQDNAANASVTGVRQFVVGSGGRNHTAMVCGLGSATPMPNLQAQNDKDFGVLKLTLRDNAYDWEFVRAGTTLQAADSGTHTGCNQ